MKFASENFDEDFCSPSNEFIVPVSISLNRNQRHKLYNFLNLHYLGDVDANKLDENGNLVAKYPDKETEQFKDALWNADVTHKLKAVVTYDTDGKPTIKRFIGKND